LSADLREDCERTVADLTTLSGLLYDYLQVYSERIIELEDLSVSHENASIPVTVMRSGTRGRPFLFIAKDQIESLMEFGYTYTKIAGMFGVSERTLLRRRIELGLPIGRNYTDISDNDLDDSIRRFTHVSVLYMYIMVPYILQLLMSRVHNKKRGESVALRM
jgi:hypothetical protein